MTSPQRTPLQRRLPRLLFRWHKRIGVAASLFVLWLAFSGVLLNHSGDLKLGLRELHSTALARWYGLHFQLPTQVYTTSHHWLASTDQAWLLDGQQSIPSADGPQGLAECGDLLAVASRSQLHLFTAEGEPLETLTSANLPLGKISQIGQGCAGIALSDGQQILTSKDGIQWVPCGETIQWSVPVPIQDTQLSQIQSRLIPAVSLEKLLQDLHSGRFFGPYGVYFVDVIALGLSLLALSGVWLYWRLNPHKAKSPRAP